MRGFLFLLMVLAMVAMVPVPLVAQSTAPTVHEAIGYQHVVATGDMLILIRHELPTADWRTSTYMGDTTCADSGDYLDACYTSVLSGGVLHTFWDGDPDTAGTNLLAVRTIPRIGAGLSGLYLGAGHGLTSGTSTYETCVEQSSSIGMLQGCQSILWRSTGTTLALTQALLEADIVAMTRNMEEGAEVSTNRWVANDQITEEGTTFPREAFAPIMDAVPAAFFAGVTGQGQDFDASGTMSLETALQTSAQSSDLYVGVTRVASQYLGMPERLAGSFVTLLIALVVTAGIVRFTDNLQFGLIGAGIVVAFGTLMTWVPLAAALVSLVLGVLLGGLWLFRRTPG